MRFLLKWIPRFVPLVTSPLKETAGIACPTVLLLIVNHRACALLGLILDTVSWHHCDPFFTAVTAV